MAFYPTKVPLHNTSRYMKPGMDPFGELIAGCRKLGMNVIARTDPHACRDDVYQAHPDWISVDENGQSDATAPCPPLADVHAGTLQLGVHDRVCSARSCSSTRWTASS